MHLPVGLSQVERTHFPTGSPRRKLTGQPRLFNTAFITGKSEIRVLLPIPVGRKLGQAAKTLFALPQAFLDLATLGNVLNGTFVKQNLALAVIDGVGMFTHPDPLAGLVAIDLGNKIDDSPLGRHQRHEFVAPMGQHVPLLGNVANPVQHGGLGPIAIHAHQRSVRPQLPSVRRSPVGPDWQQVKQRREVVFGFGFRIQGELRLHHVGVVRAFWVGGD